MTTPTTDRDRFPFLPPLTRNGYFRQRVVYPWQLPSIMRKHIYTGAMGTVWTSLISGLFFVYFGTEIGISRFGWGVMAGISSWLIGAQLFSALLVQRTGERKLIWFWFSIAERSLRLVGILLALWLWRQGASTAGAALITAICVANLFGTMASPAWLSWFADIIPEDQHGSFWGRRVAWISAAVVGVVVPTGYLIDRMPANHKLTAVTVVFVLATAIGVLDLVIHGTIPEPEMPMAEPDHFLRQCVAPLRDPAFRPWLIFNFCWTLSMALGGALATLYFIDELRIRDNFLGGTIVLTSFSLIGCVLSGHWSGRLVDRAGIRSMLYWGHMAWALLPGFWVFATPKTALVWLGLGSILGGTSSTAASTAANKLVTRYPRQEECAMYVAVSSCLGSFAGGIGVLLAGAVLEWLGDWNLALAGWRLGAFQLLFIVSMLLRFLSARLLIPRIAEPVPAA